MFIARKQSQYYSLFSEGLCPLYRSLPFVPTIFFHFAVITEKEGLPKFKGVGRLPDSCRLFASGVHIF